MGSSTFSKHDLEMIEISWSFVRDKQLLGLNTMVKIFESSKEIKKMFKFASNLESANEMMSNAQVCFHGNQMINTMDKIVILLTELSISKQDKEDLVELGQRHYHFGLKKDYFTVIYNNNKLFLFNLNYFYFF
jgi:hypothetical protein